MRNVVIVLAIVCVIGVAFLVYNNVFKKGQGGLSEGEFGAATMELIAKNELTLACSDAKSLVAMIGDINKDFADNPELGNSMSSDNMTPSMKKFEEAMDKFGKAIEGKYAGGDNATLDKIFQAVGEKVSNIFQVSIMSHLGMIQPVDLDQYIDVTFCGVKPQEGYVSPLDMTMEETFIQETIISDNATAPVANPHGGAGKAGSAPAKAK